MPMPTKPFNDWYERQKESFINKQVFQMVLSAFSAGYKAKEIEIEEAKKQEREV